MASYRGALLLAAPWFFVAAPAIAHVTAGARVFPVTLTFDDPGVGDEWSLPALNYSRAPSAGGGVGPGHAFDFGFEYDKRITENTAIILDNGYQIGQVNGARTRFGFDNLVITGKWQAITNAPHELVVSVGVQRELGGTGSTDVGGDVFGATTPTLYFGKGLGDLPVAWMRPWALTGELGYTIADRGFEPLRTSSLFADPASGAGGNGGASQAWAGALSLQYSIPYLQSEVQDLGLRGVAGGLIPTIELAWRSTATDPKTVPTTTLVAPGILYLASWGEVGVEATIPLDRAAGSTVGAVALLHFFLDDVLAGSLGNPIF